MTIFAGNNFRRQGSQSEISIRSPQWETLAQKTLSYLPQTTVHTHSYKKMRIILGEMETSQSGKVGSKIISSEYQHFTWSLCSSSPWCLLLKRLIQHAAWHPFDSIIFTSCTLTFLKMHILLSNWTQYWPPFPQGPPATPPHLEPHFVYCS